MSEHDPYAVAYPRIERRCWTDVFPGLTFCFQNQFDDKDTVWTVIVRKSVHPHNRDDCQAYLLLGSNRILTWHHGTLGGIQRIADPACELRNARLREEARDRDARSMSFDTALALGA